MLDNYAGRGPELQHSNGLRSPLPGRIVGEQSNPKLAAQASERSELRIERT